MTQLGTIQLGKGAAQRVLKIRDFVPLASLSDLVFAGWDVFPDDCYTAALKARVLENADLDSVKDFLPRNPTDAGSVRPCATCPDCAVERISSRQTARWTWLNASSRTSSDSEAHSRVDRVVMIWCGSTEVFMERAAGVHQGIKEFEAGLRTNDPAISPSMIYAYAALKCHVPFVNGTANLSVDIPALVQLAEANSVPMAGKDFEDRTKPDQDRVSSRVEGAPFGTERVVLEQHPEAIGTAKFSTIQCRSRPRR